MDSNVFPWLQYLPRDEQDDFLQEFMGLGSAGVEMGWSIETFAGKLEAHITKYMAQVRDQPDETGSMGEFRDLMRQLGASEGVPVAKVKSLKGVVGTLMWLAYLPEDEQRQFWEELFGALDDVVCDQASPSAVAYAKAAGPVLHAWKATAEVHADPVLLEALTTPLTGEDFGEVMVPAPRPEEGRLLACGLCYEENGEGLHPHPECGWVEPRYKRGSVITEGMRRWEVVDVLNAHYRVRALFSAFGEPDYSAWEFDLCQAATRLEWQKDGRDGVIGADGVSRIPQEAKTDGE